MTLASVTDLPSVFDGIEAVCFDAFGALVEITDPQAPFVPLFRALPSAKQRELKHRVLREDRPFEDWPTVLGVDVSGFALLDVLERLIIETSSIVLRPSMANIWTRLRTKGLRLAVCSNLASDYGTTLRNSLPDPPDVLALSYKVGSIMPEPEIYAHVLDGLKLDPAKVLFVGNTPRAGIKGLRAARMMALHVEDLKQIMASESRS
ncbi:hypothetical protein N9L47_12995 [Rhodobacteraceae bacterium]|nr:hypothetical protein [Paracoccaceae bacterium]